MVESFECGFILYHACDKARSKCRTTNSVLAPKREKNSGSASHGVTLVAASSSTFMSLSSCSQTRTPWSLEHSYAFLSSLKFVSQLARIEEVRVAKRGKRVLQGFP